MKKNDENCHSLLLQWQKLYGRTCTKESLSVSKEAYDILKKSELEKTQAWRQTGGLSKKAFAQ